jgi:hypothetical protein
MRESFVLRFSLVPLQIAIVLLPLSQLIILSLYKMDGLNIANIVLLSIITLLLVALMIWELFQIKRVETKPIIIFLLILVFLFFALSITYAGVEKVWNIEIVPIVCRCMVCVVLSILLWLYHIRDEKDVGKSYSFPSKSLIYLLVATVLVEVYFLFGNIFFVVRDILMVQEIDSNSTIGDRNYFFGFAFFDFIMGFCSLLNIISLIITGFCLKENQSGRFFCIRKFVTVMAILITIFAFIETVIDPILWIEGKNITDILANVSYSTLAITNLSLTFILYFTVPPYEVIADDNREL